MQKISEPSIPNSPKKEESNPLVNKYMYKFIGKANNYLQYYAITMQKNDTFLVSLMLKRSKS